MLKLIGGAVVLVAGLLFAVFIAGTYGDYKERAAGVELVNNSSADKAVTRITARALYAEYDKNEAGADLRFKGKTLVVDGLVSRVSKDLFDDVVVELESGALLPVQATVRKDSIAKAASLSKGDEVALVCISAGEVVGTPMLQSCKFFPALVQPATATTAPIAPAKLASTLPVAAPLESSGGADLPPVGVPIVWRKPGLQH